MKTLNVVITSVAIFLSFRVELICGQTKNSEREIFKNMNCIATPANYLKKKSPEEIKFICIEDYSDSVFPNDNLLKFKNLEHIAVKGRESRKKKTDTPLSIACQK